MLKNAEGVFEVPWKAGKENRQTHHYGFIAKMNLAIVCIMTVILILVTILLTQFTLKPSLEKDRLLNQEGANLLHHLVASKYDLIYDQTNLMRSNGHVGERLVAASLDYSLLYAYENSRFITDYLNALLYSDTDILDVVILSFPQEACFARSAASGRTVMTGYDFQEEPSVQMLLRSDKNIVLAYDAEQAYARHHQEPVITFLSKIYDPKSMTNQEPIGALLINYPISVFSEAYQQLGALSGGRVYVINAEDDVVFSNQDEAVGQPLAPSGNDDDLISSQIVGVSGIRVVNVIPGDVLQAAMVPLVSTLLYILAPCLLLLLAVILVLNRRYQQRLNNLADAMESIASNNLTVRLPVSHHDEIGRLSVQFNRMCESLDTHIQLHYKAKVAQRTEELHALQSQIQPHFLFNTIESIR